MNFLGNSKISMGEGEILDRTVGKLLTFRES